MTPCPTRKHICIQRVCACKCSVNARWEPWPKKDCQIQQTSTDPAAQRRCLLVSEQRPQDGGGWRWVGWGGGGVGSRQERRERHP